MNMTEMTVTTEDSTTTELSIEELDIVAGGAMDLVGAFVHGFLHTCPQGGWDSMRRAIGGCL
jgi:hypothetical protein